MNLKKQNIIQFISMLFIIVLLNIIGSFTFGRYDLTKEGRYSLSEATKSLLSDLEDYVYIEVFLEGVFPAGIQRLSNETRQILSEFRTYNDLIQFIFINPTESNDQATRNEVLKQLYEKGVNPTSLQIKDGDSFTEKVIVPGALVKYRNEEIAIQLLKSQIAGSSEQSLQQSIRELEYEFTNAIKQLKTPIKPSIALLSGHGELSGLEIEDFTTSLSEHYAINSLDLREFEKDTNSGEPLLAKKLEELLRQKLLIIAKPRLTFQNLDKYFIDQYIMNGGKVLWLLDATNADMDSLSNKGSSLFHPLRKLNLSDQLFKYGARLNTNLVEDISSSKIPVPVSFVNDIPKWELVPWRFFPVSIPTQSHPITANINAVKFDFTSSIDTVKTNSPITKTVLLHSSPYTKLVNMPYEIRLNSALEQPVQEEFNKGMQTLAILLEGEFESIFKNRITPQGDQLKFTEQSVNTRMIIVADGDIASNQISRGAALPLGYDNYEKRQYGNKDFLLNAVDYLLEDQDLINVRSREIKMRLLDVQKTQQERGFWQIINLVLPLILILTFGMLKFYIRKKKYANEK